LFNKKVGFGRKKNQAQGLVEFALVIPILLLLLVGLMEVSRLVLIYIAVTNSSREGARFGSAVGTRGGDTPQYKDCLGIREAAKRISSLAGVSDGDITIMYDHGVGTSTYATCDIITGDITFGDRIIVSVTTQYTPMGVLSFLKFSGFPISSTSRRMIQTSNPQLGVQPGEPIPTDPPIPPPPDPDAPVFSSVTATKLGDECNNTLITWNLNPTWVTNPGDNPLRYEVIIIDLSSWIVDYPGTSLDIGTLATDEWATVEVMAEFAGPVYSETLSMTFKCDQGSIADISHSP
jgi:Flp pilus assembly protein TadG